MIFFKNKNKQIKAIEPIPFQGSPTPLTGVGLPGMDKKNHTGRYVSLVFFILLAGAAVAIYCFAQKPANGVIKTSASDAKVVSAVSDVPTTFTGTYVSFMYDNKYALKSNELSKDSADVILERAYLSTSASFSKKISLTIRRLPSQNLVDDPDYLMRENNSGRYKKENFSLGKMKGISFVPVDDSQYEKSFFILHNDLVATLVMTTPGTVDKLLSDEFDAVVKSLVWLK